MKAHKRRKKKSILDKYQYNIMASVILGLLVTVLCIALSSVIVSMVDVSVNIINLLNSVNLGMGSYTAGYVSAVKRQKSGILSGTLCGLIMSIILILLGIALGGKGRLLPALCKMTISSVCGAIGGIRSANRHSV